MIDEDLIKKVFEDKKVKMIVYDMPRYTKNTSDTFQNILIEYINKPCIIDTFETAHAERRVWRNSKEDTVREYIRSTCLAGNVIFSVLGSLEIIAEEHPEITPKIRDITNITYWVEEYNKLPTTKKMEVTHNLKTTIKNVLEII